MEEKVTVVSFGIGDNPKKMADILRVMDYQKLKIFYVCTFRELVELLSTWTQVKYVFSRRLTCGQVESLKRQFPDVRLFHWTGDEELLEIKKIEYVYEKV